MKSMFLLLPVFLLLFVSSVFNFMAKYFYSHCKLLFGTLYPAYATYKALQKKGVREQSRWMMYWVCYGIFNAIEFFSDILVAFWFPFYYESKIIFILWLMSSYSNGARIFYRTVIHPELHKREKIIDSYVNKAIIFNLSGIIRLWRNFSVLVKNYLVDKFNITAAILPKSDINQMNTEIVN